VKRVVRAAWVSIVALAAACDPPGLPPQGPTPGARPTSGSESQGDSPPADPALARTGQRVFERACGRCHQGDEPSGGALADRRLTPAQMEEVIHAGSEDLTGIMPVVPPDQLPASDVPALRAYLRSIHAIR
jgi:mono/diheme cytochrome c family protein